jgi:LDH2 family malate/lactate/ureidoglycolate dehydrogenase
MTVSNQTSTVQFDVLQAFISRSLVAVDIPLHDAEVVATLMAQADLQGSDGHGVIRLPQYVKRIRAGGINTRPNIQVIQERAAMAIVDGSRLKKPAKRAWPGSVRAIAITQDPHRFMPVCR